MNFGASNSYYCSRMKYQSIFIVALLSVFSISSCTELSTLVDETGLTNEEVVAGLKSALTVGTDTSVQILSVVDGYLEDELVKILLPDEALPILTNLAKVPGGQLLIDNAIKAINRSAEDAAIEAKPIFIDAITGMTIEDGFAILKGGNSAATEYLNKNTNTALNAAFKPKISTSLNKKLVGNTSAESAYSSLITAYNTASLNGLLFAKITTNSLTDHTTEKALNGLFLKVEGEELKIRTDAEHRVNDILKKVFGE
ncbi:MAG: hypothetical protein ACI8ZN_002224 [Bacteroidia bacterium]|jgi:hypothetical protein